MKSRLSTYLHPLAGRPLAWHTLTALASAQPAPDRLILLAREELNPDLFPEIPLLLEVVNVDGEDLGRTLESLALSEQGHLFLADAAATGVAVQPLIEGSADCVLAGSNGDVAAAWLTAECAPELLAGKNGLASLAEVLPCFSGAARAEVFVVRDRLSLSRASVLMRDRLVRRLMEGGVTFLLPETVLVDVDVRIGRDSVIYPGVVLEGQTSIGEETVVGPGCRIIDSWIGSGVELKGWNYVSHSSVRNRAILEPYVRRGHD